MNIGPLVRSLVGDTKAGTPKTLELKTGQVVRGTVLSVSDDGQEAVIQVQGVKLHATLETPLQPGQTTLLQVQQPSEEGLTVLKPMGSLPGTQMSATSLGEVLKTLGLENTASNREMISQMQANGLPLTKESVSQVLQTLVHKPVEVPLSEWIQAAGIANGRGLPITGETVAGLHQAVFGPPLHELLSSLEEGIANLLRQDVTNGAKADVAGGRGAVGNTLTAPNGDNLLTQNNISAEASSAKAATATGANGASMNASSTAGANALLLQGALGGEKSAESLLVKLQNVLLELRAAVPQEALARSGADLTGAGIAKPGANSQADMTNPQAGMTRAGGDPQATGPAGSAAAGNSPAGSGQAAASAAAAAPAPAAPGEAGQLAASPSARPSTEAEPWVGRVLKLLGAEHEQQSLRAAAPSAPATGSAPLAAGTAPQATAGGANAPGGATAAVTDAGVAAPNTPAATVPLGGADKAAATTAALNPALLDNAPDVLASTGAAKETLKGLLLQIAAADDIPAPLQEAARQLIHQLTGQQLLLNTDRTSPFAQVTMFLPFFGPDGQQTASVHIESRRGHKGEMDPANCRLWFDLQMKALGQIMVDVQVADKKVLLKIYSEHEATGAFLESRQDEIEGALEATGYRLLSMKAEPLIQPDSEESVGSELGLSVSYTPTPYKGVDYRV